MTLRYGAVLSSLASLRGDPAIAELRPTQAALRYRAGRDRFGAIAPLADIYEPARPTGASAMLVHGGGFVIGSRRMKPMRYLAARLVDAGVTVCAIDYRMIFRGGRLAEATADVRDAFAFWRARAPDPHKVSLVGTSAGATLAMLAASQLDGVASVCAAFGLYEVDHLKGPARLLPRMLFGTADRAAWSLAHHPAAPALLLHGDDDGLVPVAQAERLAERRDALGLSTRLVVYPGVPHGFFNLPIPAADAGAAEIIAFVRR